MSLSTDTPSHRPESHGGTSWIEWVVAAASALLVLAAVGYLFYEALGKTQTPPNIRVTATAIRPMGDGYLVEFAAENRGGTTAASVEVEGTLAAETASATLDYVPAEGRRTGGLYFSSDPRSHPLALKATGYARP